MIIWNAETSPTGLWQSLKKMKNFIEKSSSAMKLISSLMSLLISKIFVIGQQQTQMCFLRHRCIRKKWLFGAVFMPEVWLGRIFSWMKTTVMLPSLESAIVLCYDNRFIERQIRWTCYLKKWSGRMDDSFMRSNAMGFLFMEPYQVTALCQQASNFIRPQRQYLTRNFHRSDWNMCQSGGKLGPKNGPL